MTSSPEPSISRRRLSPAKPRSTASVIGSLTFGALIMILNETVLSVALPSVMREFGVGETTGGWLTTGFLLTMAVVIPTTGYLLERFSTRTLFLGAFLMFSLGTALAAFAPAFWVLLCARIIQATGTAVILPLLMTTTLRLVPSEKRGSVMGLISVVISVAPAIGPTVSGTIMHSHSWRMIFGFILPLALITMVVGLVGLGRSQPAGAGRLDLISVPLSAVGFGSLVYGLSSITQVAEGDWLPAAGLVIGVAALWVFVRRQTALARAGADPLLNLAPLAVPTYRRSLIVLCIGMGSALGSIIVLPIYLQTGRGFESLQIGLALLPGGLLQAALSSVFGRVYDRFGHRPLIIPGAFLLPTALFGFALMTSSTPLWFMTACHMVFCTGMAALMTALMTHSLGALPAPLYPHGSAIVSTAMQLAGAVGTALLLAALAVGIGVTGTAASGARYAFIFAGCCALVIIPLVFRIAAHPAPQPEDADAAAPGQPERSEGAGIG